VRATSLFGKLLSLGPGSIVEDVRLEPDGLVLAVRVSVRQQHRCGVCKRRSPRFDAGAGQRRWRSLDVGSTRCFLEGLAPRVSCRQHGVVVAAVPWAAHQSRFTSAFEDQVAWLAINCDLSAVAELMRISWRSVGRILERVSRRSARGRDLLANLRRIGIDEISYGRGHQRYLTVVVDHDSGRLVWARQGRDTETLDRFFFELGYERAAELTHVSTDAAAWYLKVLNLRCPQAVICVDPFHVVAWANMALDKVRIQVWRAAREEGGRTFKRDFRGLRWALCKAPDDLTTKQADQLAWVQEVNQPLYRAYLLKEHLRLIFQLPADQAISLLLDWIGWAMDSELRPFQLLAASVTNHYRAIIASIQHRLSNARTESLNTRIRLLIHRAFGFHSARPLVALAMLSFGGLAPALPGRA